MSADERLVDYVLSHLLIFYDAVVEVLRRVDDPVRVLNDEESLDRMFVNLSSLTVVIAPIYDKIKGIDKRGQRPVKILLSPDEGEIIEKMMEHGVLQQGVIFGLPYEIRDDLPEGKKFMIVATKK